MSTHPSRTSGFTLIEILVSIAIVGIIVVLYQLVLSDTAHIRKGKNQETALRIVTSKIEEVRALGYDQIPVSGSFSDTQLSALPQGAGTLTVTAFNADTKQVVTTVTWREPGIVATQSISLATLITSIGGL